MGGDLGLVWIKLAPFFEVLTINVFIRKLPVRKYSVRRPIDLVGVGALTQVRKFAQ